MDHILGPFEECTFDGIAGHPVLEEAARLRETRKMMCPETTPDGPIYM
jgi:hypothetical protein